MIEPTSQDVGRYVVYIDVMGTTAEAGRISSFNDATVFVSFPKRHITHEAVVQGCDRRSLHWLSDFVAKGVL